MPLRETNYLGNTRLCQTLTFLLCSLFCTDISLADDPFAMTDSTYIGPSIMRPVAYDGSPSILYDPDDPSRKFKMWWLGRYLPDDPDLPPFDHSPDDRVYFSYSSDGTLWSQPEVVLKGRSGLAGFDAADDVLVGSPSILKIDGKYYMFYEAYGKAFTLIARFFSPTRGDTWVYPGDSLGLNWEETNAALGYDWDVSHPQLGVASLNRKTGTHPIYAGEVTYTGGHVNRYLSCNPVTGPPPGNVDSWWAMNDGNSVLWLYDQDAPGRKPLYTCFAPEFANSFVSDDPGCEGFAPDGLNGCDGHLLGYAIDSIANAEDVLVAPDMANANQNRVCLAIWDPAHHAPDSVPGGVGWERFPGAAPGQAVLAPTDSFTNMWPHPCADPSLPSCWELNPDPCLWAVERFDVHRAYGSGYPIAIIRDGYLEIYFTDDTLIPMTQCLRPPRMSRIRIPVQDIGNAAAYVGAERQYSQAGVPSDMKWSPMFQRYFIPWGFDRGTGTHPELLWSQLNPDPNGFPVFPTMDNFVVLPDGGINGVGIGLLGSGDGHTVGFPDAPQPYTAFHVWFNNEGDTVFDGDLYHTLLFGYPTDSDLDGVPDWSDNCPFDDNPDQSDADSDGSGDACDACPNDSDNDVDGDGVCGNVDNCPVDHNPEQADADMDGIGNVCDPCPNDPTNDVDSDGICGNVDNCPLDYNPDQADGDTDGIGNICDPCPNDSANDVDTDGFCGDIDNCPVDYNPTQADADTDGVGDACDACPNDPNNDVDGDGLCATPDNCPNDYNPGQEDTDSDGAGDVCDGCPTDPNKTEPGQCGCSLPETDSDSDGTANCNDPCAYDSTQTEPNGCGCRNVASASSLYRLIKWNSNTGSAIVTNAEYRVLATIGQPIGTIGGTGPQNAAYAFRAGFAAQSEASDVVLGDSDFDCDIDLFDFQAFHDCVGGPVSPAGDGCGPMDFDADSDVDLRDFGLFQRAFGGGS